jgi:hypothetical protein
VTLFQGGASPPLSGDASALQARESAGLITGSCQAHRRFTEGFDTIDLQDAKALLKELDG